MYRLVLLEMLSPVDLFGSLYVHVFSFRVLFIVEIATSIAVPGPTSPHRYQTLLCFFPYGVFVFGSLVKQRRVNFLRLARRLCFEILCCISRLYSVIVLFVLKKNNATRCKLKTKLV